MQKPELHIFGNFMKYLMNFVPSFHLPASLDGPLQEDGEMVRGHLIVLPK